METTTIHPAESYLRNETNPSSLYVRIAGKRRRLFINRDRGVIGIVAPGKRTKGYVFTDWSSIEQIYYPSQEQEANTDRKLILKYQKLARLATIEKYCGTASMQRFREAMKNKDSFSTCRFDFCGYDGTLWCEPRDNGDMSAGFSKEYRNCGNGYYYLLINDEYVIGYDID